MQEIREVLFLAIQISHVNFYNARQVFHSIVWYGIILSFKSYSDAI